MARRADIPSIVAVLLTAALLVSTALLQFCPALRGEDPSFGLRGTFRALIDQNPQQKGSGKLIIGYSYFLLKSFASDSGVSSDVRMTGSDADALQALLSGEADIVCVPPDKDFECPDIIYSRQLDGFCKWAMLRNRTRDMVMVNDWINRYHADGERALIRKRFLNPSSPWKKNLSCASPYDSLIRKSAGLHGLDWRLLAAVIHQESRFHIESVSHHGAKGLGQFIDGTAEIYGISNPLDPEENIEACASHLEKMYRSVGGCDGDDRMKFALAAYNGGIGTVLDCLACADSLEMGRGWDDVREVMLIQSRDSVLVEGTDSLAANSRGRNYLETAEYVGKVLSRYEAYKRNLPE